MCAHRKHVIPLRLYVSLSDHFIIFVLPKVEGILHFMDSNLKTSVHSSYSSTVLSPKVDHIPAANP